MDREIISNKISKTKLISIFVTAVIVLSSAVILIQQQKIDSDIVIFHNFVYENAFLLNFFQFVSAYGMGFISLLYGILAFLTFKIEELKPHRPMFIFIILCFAFGSIAGDLLKEVINRARPIVDLAGQIAITTLSDSPSFPSGHATKSLVLALPFVIVASGKDVITKLLKAIALTSAVLVSYSRIALQKHYLSDVLAALGISLIFVIVTNWFVNRLYKAKKFDQAKLEVISKRLGLVFSVLAVVLCLI